MNIIRKAIKFLTDTIGESSAVSNLISDHGVSVETLKIASSKYGNLLDAIADGFFGNKPDLIKIAKRYGRQIKSSVTNKRSDDSNAFVRTKRNAWLFDAINESLRQSAQSTDYQEPQSFKDKIRNAEFVEAEVISE